MGIKSIIEMLSSELQAERQLVDYMQKRSENIPEGALFEHTGRNDKYFYLQVYLNREKQNIFLDQYDIDDRRVIKELMEKKTIVHGLPILRKNIKAMEKCLARLESYHPAMFKYGELLGNEYYLKGDVCIKDWKKKPESQNPFHRQGLVHETKRGVNVRSKSEVLISDSVYDFGLLSKYETVFKTKQGKIFYPDFEILHPKTGEIIWWEHLGRADDGGYVRNNLEKLETYGKAGLIPGKNLIITSETENVPLTRSMVESKLKEYGLI